MFKRITLCNCASRILGKKIIIIYTKRYFSIIVFNLVDEVKAKRRRMKTIRKLLSPHNPTTPLSPSPPRSVAKTRRFILCSSSFPSLENKQVKTNTHKRRQRFRLLQQHNNNNSNNNGRETPTGSGTVLPGLQHAPRIL